jgi:hypothetical protein
MLLKYTLKYVIVKIQGEVRQTMILTAEVCRWWALCPYYGCVAGIRPWHSSVWSLFVLCTKLRLKTYITFKLAADKESYILMDCRGILDKTVILLEFLVFASINNLLVYNSCRLSTNIALDNRSCWNTVSGFIRIWNSKTYIWTEHYISLN